jgi:hypothetical protein
MVISRCVPGGRNIRFRFTPHTFLRHSFANTCVLTLRVRCRSPLLSGPIAQLRQLSPLRDDTIRNTYTDSILDLGRTDGRVRDVSDFSIPRIMAGYLDRNETTALKTGSALWVPGDAAAAGFTVNARIRIPPYQQVRGLGGIGDSAPPSLRVPPPYHVFLLFLPFFARTRLGALHSRAFRDGQVCVGAVPRGVCHLVVRAPSRYV